MAAFESCKDLLPGLIILNISGVSRETPPEGCQFLEMGLTPRQHPVLSSRSMTKDTNKPVSVLLVDDHTGVSKQTAGLGLLKDLSIVALVDRSVKALETYGRLRPDIVILLCKTAWPDTINLVEDLCQEHEGAQVIMLMDVCDPDIMTKALEAGVRGICLKSTSSRRIRVGIECILKGEIWFDEGLLKPLITSIRKSVKLADVSENRAESTEVLLTDRQRHILSLVSQGYSNKKIGSLLFVSHETVKSHLQRIMERLAANDRTEAVVKAIKLDLI